MNLREIPAHCGRTYCAACRHRCFSRHRDCVRISIYFQVEPSRHHLRRTPTQRNGPRREPQLCPTPSPHRHRVFFRFGLLRQSTLAEQRRAREGRAGPALQHGGGAWKSQAVSGSLTDRGWLADAGLLPDGQTPSPGAVDARWMPLAAYPSSQRRLHPGFQLAPRLERASFPRALQGHRGGYGRLPATDLPVRRAQSVRAHMVEQAQDWPWSCYRVCRWPGMARAGWDGAVYPGTGASYCRRPCLDVATLWRVDCREPTRRPLERCLAPADLSGRR